MKLLSVLLALLLASVVSAVPVIRCYDAIFSFGDSHADTGNNIPILAERSLPNPAAGPPYGMEFFGRPTGRNSNGRLIIDFVAEDLGLPFVPPSLTHNGSFCQGASFAVAGAFARNASFYSRIPIIGPSALNTSSSVQLQWFDSLKPSLSLCNPAQEFHKSLFFMGEFGVNDYSFSVFAMNISEIKFVVVPNVIKTIWLATERLINKYGAKTVVVPGIPPLGCSPPNLALHPSNDSDQFDERTGCLKQLNDLSLYHNLLLKKVVEKLQKRYPSVRVIYADFFTPVMSIVQSPQKFGFTKDILRCCCGGGGKYNFNMSAGCGMPGATVCEDPSAHLYWDGHFTEAANRHIANGWLNSIKNVGYSSA